MNNYEFSLLKEYFQGYPWSILRMILSLFFVRIFSCFVSAGRMRTGAFDFTDGPGGLDGVTPTRVVIIENPTSQVVGLLGLHEHGEIPFSTGTLSSTSSLSSSSSLESIPENEDNEEESNSEQDESTEFIDNQASESEDRSDISQPFSNEDDSIDSLLCDESLETIE